MNDEFKEVKLDDAEVKPNVTEVLRNVADTVLDAATKIQINILHPTRLERLLIRFNRMKPYREFNVKPASLGKFILISKLLIDINVKDLDLTNAYNAIQGLAVSHGETLAEVVAVAIHPGRGNPPKSLVKFLLDNLTNQEMQQMALLVLDRSNSVSFFATIVSMKGADLLRTSPQDQREIIAPGTPSAG